MLLSSDTPSQVRLADFGISRINQEVGLTNTTLAQTAHGRGSPIYSAPELLYNPYNMTKTTDSDHSIVEVPTQLVAKPSRKTDMYAFAVLLWEVMAEQPPYREAHNEAMLSAMVHQGQRPSLDLLPKDCPARVVQLITSCWESDRDQRKTAFEATIS